MFIKSIIEVAIVFFLIQVFLSKNNNDPYFMQFGVFLLLSALWNAIVINHSKIKLVSFLYKCCFDNVTRDYNIRHYIAPYIRKIDSLKEELDAEVENIKKAEGALLLFLWLKHAVISASKSIIGLIAQIVSSHLIIINFFVGVLFLFYDDIQCPVVHSIISSLSWPVWLSTITIIFLVVMLFGCLYLSSKSKKFCCIPSLFLLLFFLFFYYNLNANFLICAMLIQQGLIIIFIRVYGGLGDNTNRTGNSES